MRRTAHGSLAGVRAQAQAGHAAYLGDVDRGLQALAVPLAPWTMAYPHWPFPPYVQQTWVRVGAVAAVIGGAAWTVKALSVLIFLYQPPFVFEFGPPLFVLGTWALWRAAWTPTALMVYAAVLLGIVTAVYAAVGVMHLVDETPDLLSLAATLTLLLSLTLVGIGVRRRRTLPPPWHHLPFWMGLLMVPVLALFGGVGVWLGPAAEERLIEVPILLFGLGWITVGYRLFPMADAVDETSGA